MTLWGTFFNTACPGVYIEQNAPRAVRSKARVWTERPARGAFTYLGVVLIINGWDNDYF